MATFTDVFERKEVKYRLNAQQYQAMVASLSGIMVLDEFGCTHVVSMYFDTPDRSLIDRSMEKPLYKEKLRLRSYGVPQEDDRVYVEIKKKYKGIVYKRRVGLSYAAARAYLGGASYEAACRKHPLPDALMASESISVRSVQISREIDQFIACYSPLQSSMTIACQRTAYASVDAPELGCESHDLRLTFDTDIAYRDMFALAGERAPRSLLDEGEAILEIKSAGPFPLWLVRALCDCKAYPSSFSKYGEAYRVCAARERGLEAAAFAQQPLSSSVAAAVRLNRLAAFASRRAVEPPHAERPASRAMRCVAEESTERFAAEARDARFRRFCAPNHTMKKGDHCA